MNSRLNTFASMFTPHENIQTEDWLSKPWWLHARPLPEIREATGGLRRFICTPGVSKHRIFVWLSPEVLPDHAMFAFSSDDDYFLGVLHSRLHEVWSRAQGTQLSEAESGFRYTPTSTFETYPFPWPPSREPKDSPLVGAIAEAARALVEKRYAWLNPPNASAEKLKNARSRTSTMRAPPGSQMHTASWMKPSSPPMAGPPPSPMPNSWSACSP